MAKIGTGVDLGVRSPAEEFRASSDPTVNPYMDISGAPIDPNNLTETVARAMILDHFGLKDQFVNEGGVSNPADDMVRYLVTDHLLADGVTDIYEAAHMIEDAVGGKYEALDPGKIVYLEDVFRMKSGRAALGATADMGDTLPEPASPGMTLTFPGLTATITMTITPNDPATADKAADPTGAADTGATDPANPPYPKGYMGITAQDIEAAKTGNTEPIERKLKRLRIAPELLDAATAHFASATTDPTEHAAKIQSDGGLFEHLDKKGLVAGPIPDAPPATPAPGADAGGGMADPAAPATYPKGYMGITAQDIEAAKTGNTEPIERKLKRLRIAPELLDAATAHFASATTDPTEHAAKIQSDGGLFEHLDKKGLVAGPIPDAPPAAPAPGGDPAAGHGEHGAGGADAGGGMADPAAPATYPKGYMGITAQDIEAAKTGNTEPIERKLKRLRIAPELLDAATAHFSSATTDPTEHAAKIQSDGGLFEHLDKKGLVAGPIPDAPPAAPAIPTPGADAKGGATDTANPPYPQGFMGITAQDIEAAKIGNIEPIKAKLQQLPGIKPEFIAAATEHFRTATTPTAEHPAKIQADGGLFEHLDKKGMVSGPLPDAPPATPAPGADAAAGENEACAADGGGMDAAGATTAGTAMPGVPDNGHAAH